MHAKVEKRFLKAVRSSGLVEEDVLQRAIDLQGHARTQGLQLPLDRILLKLEILSRDQILKLWRALRYYVWRKEDKLYVKIAMQSKLMDSQTAKTCLKEQKRAYKQEDVLMRVNEIARQRGYLKEGEDLAVVEAMHRIKEELTIGPVDEATAGQTYERPSEAAARKEDGDEWREQARSKDISALRNYLESSGGFSGGAMSDEDLDALWEEADLDDVELDSQAVEIARAPLFGDEDSDEDFDLFGDN